MSIRILALILDGAFTADPIEQFVLVVIANFCDDRGANAWPSIATLAKKTRFNRRSVQRAIARLIGRGVLLVTPGKIGRRPYTYRINLEWCQTVTGDSQSPVTQSHPPPVTHSHPTGDSLTPDPFCTSSDPSEIQDPRVRANADTPTEETKPERKHKLDLDRFDKVRQMRTGNRNATH